MELNQGVPYAFPIFPTFPIGKENLNGFPAKRKVNFYNLTISEK